MADFCNYCAEYMFGNKCKPDIDVYEIIKDLEENYVMPCMCEGCCMVAVGKKDNKPHAIFQKYGEASTELIDYEENWYDWFWYYSRNKKKGE